MKKIAATLLLTFLLLTSCGGQTPPPSTPTTAPISTASPSPTGIPVSPFLIIGYLPDYRDINLDWGKSITDIIYFSAEPRADGTLDTDRLSKNTLNQLHQMQALYGTRIHISIGGWERGDNFAAMTSSAQTRAAFVENLATYLHDNKLNGADFDWEFPQTETEFQNYILLLNEIHANFQSKGLILSVALPPNIKFPLKDFTVADRIHIMSYDRGSRHSTYDQAVQDLQSFLDAGLPREKLILGVPFYGRKISVPHDETTYAEIVDQYHPAPDVDEVNGIYFNGIATIQKKTCFAIDQKIGGVMIWELGQDTNDSTSLLQAIQHTSCGG